MTKLFKNLFSYQIDPLENYASILEQIVKWILIALVATGTPAVTIGIVEAIQLHQPQSAFLYLALFLPIVILLGIRKMFSYKVSAFIIVAAIFALALQNSIIYGFSGAGIPLFLTFFMLVTIFYGLKAGLFSIFLGVASISLLGYLMVTEKISVQIDLMHITTLPISWLTATSTLVLLGLVMVLSYSFIHFNLLNAIRITKWHAKKLKKAKGKAEESDRLKSAFLANMSHEIRTPMNGILGFTDLLKNPELSGEQQQKYIEIIQKSGNRMLETVNAIIDISKIETGQTELKMSTIDIKEEVESLYRFFSQETEQRGLKLEIEELPSEKLHCLTDKYKFNSIFTNLIKNALKFTSEGSIKIGCKISDNRLHCYVKDTGIGIPEDRQEAIFNRFVQADIEDTLAYEGSGLGLAIAKAYAEMLGGEIGVDSVEGKGSTFWFNIPEQAEKFGKDTDENESGNSTII